MNILQMTGLEVDRAENGEEAVELFKNAPEGKYTLIFMDIQMPRMDGYEFLSILREAGSNIPVLIVTANKKGYGNAMADSSCALENMMIAANALDLGSCWINQLHWLDGDARVRGYLEKLGLKADETVTGGLILGCGCDGLPVRSERKRTGNPVTWIE